MKFISLIIGLALLPLSLVSAQKLDREDFYNESVLAQTNVAPQSKVLDIGEVFSRDAKGYSHLSQRLLSIEEKYGFSVYFVAYSGIIGSNVQERAEEFRDLWLKEGEEGLIFVCDTDMRAFAFSLAKPEKLSPEGFAPPWKLSDYDALQKMKFIIERDATDSSETEYLRRVGNRMASELEEHLATSSLRQSNQTGIYFVVFSIASLFVFGLIMLALKRAKNEINESRGVRFPRIKVPSRLGAAYGGGMVCEISFEPRPRN